jgi:hypothetical protein
MGRSGNSRNLVQVQVENTKLAEIMSTKVTVQSPVRYLHPARMLSELLGAA